MTTWKYSFQFIPDTADREAFERQCDRAGADGWEAVAVWHEGNKRAVLFKQPIISASPRGESLEETLKNARK
ncbi:MAG TPA: hypothetical protein VHA33_23550 [Candidatus Angelobacter sp.]|jgi:hypothetical protein|nr:hypothetical protein [Candidatus Angelobacter sp.]